MKDWSLKKAAKKLIKRAKKRPEWYTQEDINYAKEVKKRIKLEERKSSSETE